MKDFIIYTVFLSRRIFVEDFVIKEERVFELLEKGGGKKIDVSKLKGRDRREYRRQLES